ncbi:hypothetical protein H5410_022415 [Solanum commersonii]|uniref:Uncharacterized protein n=1 Tax=Solanum commersonii TaxID=4109 RepID=A0A9J5ZJ94_SOLCO|nr:hypothetical protein H5410_022415 [Solanum commersonii]
MMFPSHVPARQNRWCVEGQWKISEDAKMVNNKRENGRPDRVVLEVLTRELKHRTLSVVQSSQRAPFLRGQNPARDPLTSTLVRVHSRHIPTTTVRQFLYGPSCESLLVPVWPSLTTYGTLCCGDAFERLRRRGCADTAVDQIHSLRDGGMREWSSLRLGIEGRH